MGSKGRITETRAFLYREHLSGPHSHVGAQQLPLKLTYDPTAHRQATTPGPSPHGAGGRPADFYLKALPGMKSRTTLPPLVTPKSL